jgi:hypothetical protein
LTRWFRPISWLLDTLLRKHMGFGEGNVMML